MKLKRFSPRRKSWAMTMIETLPPIGIAGFLAATMLPALGKAKGRANRIKCTSNLSQISKSLVAFCYENDDRLPWHQIPRGRIKPQFTGDAIFNRKNFPTIAADLGIPIILLSPCDSAYKAANEKIRRDFSDPDPQGISYGIHHGGDCLSPNTILGLTRNVAGKPAGQYYYSYRGQRWAPEGRFFASIPKAVDAVWQGNADKKFGMGGLRNSQGQLARSDGSAMQLNNLGFGREVDRHNRTRDGLNPEFNANIWRSHQ